MPLRDQHLGKTPLGLDPTKERDALVDESECAHQVALSISRQRQVVERKADRPLRPELPEHREALLTVCPHSRDIALIACHIAKAQQTVGHPLAILKCAVELQALVEQRRSVCKIALLAPYQRQKVE